MVGEAPGAPGSAELPAAAEALRGRLAAARLPLAAQGVDEVRALRASLVAQLDDYVLPRLARLDAPLLVVVGGSTGAGKSTLVNSLVGSVVSASGVLRPTTRGPVLAHHPDDAAWFLSGGAGGAGGHRLLPGLARATGDASAGDDAGALRLVAEPAVPRGLALLDAPDVDSVVTANRELAAQLLAAADLWLFLTTAARYADAVPWALLREASARSAAVAVVLDRVPREALEEVRADLAGMLRAEGLGDSPLFVVPEVPLHGGLLPEPAVAPLRGWLSGLSVDAAARAAVVRRTLRGVLSSYPQRVAPLAAGLEEQERVAAQLRAVAVTAYDDASEAVEAGVKDGSLLRGEVLARWQDVVGTSDLLRALQVRVGRARDAVGAAVRGRQRPTDELAVALESGVEALVLAEADRAAERTAAAWRAAPAGRALLAEVPAADRVSDELRERVGRTVRDWQGAVLELVRREGGGRKRSAQFLAYGVNGVGLAVMVAVFASTGGITGGEVVVAGGASALSQKVLEALLGDQAVRTLAARAREDLRARVDALLAQERERFTRPLDAHLEESTSSRELLRAARQVAALAEGAR
ncbi:MAG: ABC transporter [Motilibacteraceae bacterium]